MAKRRRDNYKQEMALAAQIDELSEYEEWKATVLPALRRAVKEGKSAEDIQRMVQSIAAAQVATILVRDRDSKKVLSAAKDILDRTQGKAKERLEVSSPLEKLPEDQLDSLLLAKLTPKDEKPKH